MKHSIMLIFICSNMCALQNELPENFRMLLAITQQRIDTILDPELKEIAQQHNKNQGLFLSKIRAHYAQQKSSLWSFFTKPIVAQKKMIAYFQCMQMHSKDSDLSFQDFNAIYWPIVSAHIDYAYMAQGLAREHTYGTKLLYGMDIPLNENPPNRIRMSKELKKFETDTVALLGTITDAQYLTYIYTEPMPSQQELLVNPTFAVIKALHSVHYKRSFERFHALLPLYKINLLFQHNNRGNTILHALVNQHLPAVLLKSIATLLIEKYELPLDEENDDKKTPLGLATDGNFPLEIKATIESLHGTLKNRKTVTFG